MSRRVLLPGLLAGLLLGGCGSSNHTSATAAVSSAASSTTVASTPSTTTSIATTTKTSSSTTTSRTATSKVVAPPPASGPRIPATFTIGAGGTLSPPTISVPTGYTVQVTFINHGTSSETATVHTPKPVVLTAAAGTDADALVSHLHKGTYPISIDGAVRGSLTLGAAPGP